MDDSVLSSSMPSDLHANGPFCWEKISLTKEEEELIGNLPLPPRMTAVGGKCTKINDIQIVLLPPRLCRKRSTKKNEQWKMLQRDDDPFLAAYEVCTKKESYKWRNLKKRLLSIFSRKQFSKFCDINLALDESCMLSEDVPFSWEKKTGVYKLQRPESLTIEEEKLLDNLPLPPYMTQVGGSRKVSAYVHQDILNLPVPLCVFQPPYHKRSAKKGLWRKQQDHNPFLTAYKFCTEEEDKKKSGVTKGSLTREEEELLEEILRNFPLPPCTAEVGERDKINANVQEDIQNMQDDDSF